MKVKIGNQYFRIRFAVEKSALNSRGKETKNTHCEISNFDTDELIASANKEVIANKFNSLETKRNALTKAISKTTFNRDERTIIWNEFNNKYVR